MKNYNLQALWGGAGLRHEHFEAILKDRPPFRWFEIILENFLNIGGYSRECLLEICKHYRVIGHGVCLSIGSTDPLNYAYLNSLKPFLAEIRSPWASDHLCFTMIDHTNLNDLIPLPFTDEAVRNTVSRIKIVQDILERPFLIENVTRYITVSDREMAENEFISRVVEEANCGLLLDLTNVYLNGKFHGYDAFEFVRSLPLQRVGQVHLAGWVPHSNGAIIDSHDAPVPEEVWDLFGKVMPLLGETSVLVEWDSELPAAARLLEETQLVDTKMAQALKRVVPELPQRSFGLAA
jgi:uncharacterized protein (UPF0276 family)